MTTDKAEKKTTRGRGASAKKDQPEPTQQTPTPSPKPEGPRGRYSLEQRTDLLAQAQKLVDSGASWQSAAEAIGVRPDNLRRWRQGVEASQSPAQRIKALEAENKRLRSAVASLATRVADLDVNGPMDENVLIERQRTALAEQALRIAELEASSS